MRDLGQRRQFRKILTADAEGLETRKPSDVTILQNKGINDGEESYLMSLSLKLKHHLFGNMHSVAHTNQKIRAFRLNHAHRGDILTCDCPQLLNAERDNRTGRSVSLELVERLLGSHMARQKTITESIHAR